ncbi:MAG TPA: sterol desaturase family protein [Polyangiaceae bacterium]|nr:sterol desaturase family protein [Polyangiaceae bacterium]
MSELISGSSGLLRITAGPWLAPAARTVVFLVIVFWTLRFLRRCGAISGVTTPSRRSLLTDLVYLTMAPIMELLSQTLTTLTLIAAACICGHELSPRLLAGFGPVIRQPWLLIVLEMLVFSDFVYYWVHRLAHTVPALWRFHAVHHSTEHLRWTSALRAHPVELYLHPVVALPLLLVGFPPGALAAAMFVSGLYSFWIHANVNVSARPLHYILNSPRYHAWHHARDATDGTVNYAGFFPFFDVLFGSYKQPEGLPREFGLDDPATLEVPQDFLGQLKYPFQRRLEPSHPELRAPADGALT